MDDSDLLSLSDALSGMDREQLGLYTDIWKPDLMSNDVNRRVDSGPPLDSDSEEAMEELADGNESWSSGSPRGARMETLHNMRHVFEPSDTLSSLLSLLDAKKVRSISKRTSIPLKTW